MAGWTSAQSIMWGTSILDPQGASIMWGTSDDETIEWSTSDDESIMWGTTIMTSPHVR